MTLYENQTFTCTVTEQMSLSNTNFYHCAANNSFFLRERAREIIHFGKALNDDGPSITSVFHSNTFDNY
jgi:hypothetical protein